MFTPLVYWCGSELEANPFLVRFVGSFQQNHLHVELDN